MFCLDSISSLTNIHYFTDMWHNFTGNPCKQGWVGLTPKSCRQIFFLSLKTRGNLCIIITNTRYSTYSTCMFCLCHNLQNMCNLKLRIVIWRSTWVGCMWAWRKSCVKKQKCMPTVMSSFPQIWLLPMTIPQTTSLGHLVRNKRPRSRSPCCAVNPRWGCWSRGAGKLGAGNMEYTSSC